MKILYLHQYFRTPQQGGALRSYYLSTALAEAGHDVELITAYNGAGYKVESVRGVKVHYLPVPYDNSFGFIKRSLSFLNFVLKSTWLTFKIKNVDICFATSTPLTIGLPALLLKLFNNVPYIFEVRDLWPDAPVQLGFIRNPLLKKLLFWLERSLYCNASKIVALSPGMVTGIKKNYLKVPVFLIPNMADIDFYQPAYTNKTSPDAPFIISYIGTLGKANRLTFLLAAAKACQEAKLEQVRFYVAGSGAELDLLKQQATNWSLTNVQFLGSLSRDEVRELLYRSEATYTSFDEFPVLQTNSPNKFFDSLAAGKLCIVNTKGWLQALVEENKCGFYAEPNRPEALVEQLIPFLKDAQLLREYQKRARILAEGEFSREKLTFKFVQLFSSSKE